MDAIVGCLGPIARSARDLGLFCRVMDKYEPWLLESALLEIPWRHNVEQGLTLPAKLSFAFLWDDGVVAPEKAILEELRRCKDRLLAAGHTVIDWDPLQHKEAWDLIVSWGSMPPDRCLTHSSLSSEMPLLSGWGEGVFRCLGRVRGASC